MKARIEANYITPKQGYIIEISDQNNHKYLMIDGKLKVFTSCVAAKYARDLINLNNNK